MGHFEEHSGGITPLPASRELACEGGLRFLEASETFRQLIESARIRPSEYALEAVAEQRSVASEIVAPMKESLFFRTSDDEELIKTAAGAVLHETEQNWHLATKIDPNDPSPNGYPEGLRDMLVAKLMESEVGEEDLDHLPPFLVIDIGSLETLSELPADALVRVVCGAYELSLESLYRSLMTSSEIIDHSFEQAEKERRRERTITVSLATIGAFVASSIAYAIAQRRKK